MNQLDKLEQEHKEIKRPLIWFDLTPIFKYIFKKVFK
mgnify:CR=1 FL=1